jgi:hypothetical protein
MHFLVDIFTVRICTILNCPISIFMQILQMGIACCMRTELIVALRNRVAKTFQLPTRSLTHTGLLFFIFRDYQHLCLIADTLFTFAEPALSTVSASLTNYTIAGKLMKQPHMLNWRLIRMVTREYEQCRRPIMHSCH